MNRLLIVVPLALFPIYLMSQDTTFVSNSDNYVMPTWMVAIVSASIGALVGPLINLVNSNRQRNHERSKIELQEALNAIKVYNNHLETHRTKIKDGITICQAIIESIDDPSINYSVQTLIDNINLARLEEDELKGYHDLDLFLEPDSLLEDPKDIRLMKFNLHVKVKLYNDKYQNEYIDNQHRAFIEEILSDLEIFLKSTENRSRKVRAEFRKKFGLELSVDN